MALLDELDRSKFADGYEVLGQQVRRLLETTAKVAYAIEVQQFATRVLLALPVEVCKHALGLERSEELPSDFRLAITLTLSALLSDTNSFFEKLQVGSTAVLQATAVMKKVKSCVFFPENGQPLYQNNTPPSMLSLLL